MRGIKRWTETPWIDIARQLAGDAGVKALGKDAQSSPPGTETLQTYSRQPEGHVLILCDEVLNFVNRHRKIMTRSMRSFKISRSQ
jgi:hypothetical protein